MKLFKQKEIQFFQNNITFYFKIKIRIIWKVKQLYFLVQTLIWLNYFNALDLKKFI